MPEHDLDRNLAATPYKLQKARERGQVAKSADVVSAAVFTAAMVFLSWQGWQTWQALFRLDRALLLQVGRLDTSPAAVWTLIDTTLRSTLRLAGPFFVTLLLVAVVGNLAQTGPVASLDPLRPDWNRVNPLAGLERIFSLRTLFFALRALLKLALVGAVAFFALQSLVPHLHAVAGLSASGMTRTLLADVASLGLKMALALWFIAALDALYARREFAKQMRMSHRELKDEIKHREGDPRIRARLKELRRELLKRALALRGASKADVVITNPTHLAVALRYVHGQMEAPQVLAKGAGAFAVAIRRVAGRHGIPVVENPPLARQLFHEVQANQTLPAELYAPVARILAWVFAMREARARRGAVVRPSRAAKLPAAVPGGMHS